VWFNATTMVEGQDSDTIETERLLLRRVRPEEARALLDGKTVPGLTLAEGYPGEFSLEVMDIYVGERTADVKGFSPYFIIRRAEGDVIGEIGYSFPDDTAVATTGYDIVEPLWGRGYASEALRGLIGHLFAQDGIEVVDANTFETHVASRRVMEKAGMKHVRTAQDVVDGEEATLVYYEIRREGGARLAAGT
jgi:aminoglycoside 6'-N-acetyltransferase